MATQEISGVRYLENDIAKLQRRIKKVRENPDPRRPRANLLLYEAELDLRVEQLEGVKTGKPLGWVSVAGLTRALGFIPWDGINSADRTSGEEAKKYFEHIRKEGMAEHTCDRTIIILPMVLNGDFPKPSFLFTSNFECIPVHLAHCSIANLLDIPIYMVDRHFDPYALMEDEEKLKYMTDQVEKLVQYAQEKVPGCRYNEDILLEMQHYDRLFLQKNQELYEIKKNIPCPIPGRDAFRELRLASSYPKPAKIIEYMNMYVEEMAVKAAKGEGSVEGKEKLRLLWSVSGPFFADPFTWLAKKGVAVPAAEMSLFNMWFSKRQAIFGDPWKGRKLTPLEEEARQLDWLWGRLGDQWIQTNINTCADLKLDGIIYFMQWGCSVTNGLGRVLVETAEKVLGIPTLLVEGRMLDDSIFDEKDFFNKLEDFVDICQERKQRRN